MIDLSRAGVLRPPKWLAMVWGQASMKHEIRLQLSFLTPTGCKLRFQLMCRELGSNCGILFLEALAVGRAQIY